MSGGRPGCHTCKSPVAANGVFCTVCWSDVPTGARKALEQAQTAMGRNPTSRKVRENFVTAVQSAARHVP